MKPSYLLAVVRKCAISVFFLAIPCIFTSCGGSSNSSGSNPPTVATISVSPSSLSIAAGATQQFTATAKDSNGTTINGVTFNWASSATNVATINSSGLATGVSAGTTQITASATGVTSSADTLTITAPAVASITVSPSSASIAVGVTQQFTATAKDSSGNTISGVTFTWASSATNVATINSSGLVTAVTAGTTQITAAAGNVTSAGDTLTVTPPPISVSISPTNPTVTVDATDQFTATVINDSNAAGVTWALTQNGVACSPTCGTITPTSGTGNSPTTTYSAPATVPNPATVTLTATSVTDTAKSASTTITVAAETSCASKGNESLLNGQYALLLKGFDSAGHPALIGGVLTFNGTDHNGLITAGAIDMNLNSGVQLNLAVTSGSYGVGTDERGCMVITTSAGTQNYRVSLGNISGGVASTGHVIGFDQGGPFTTGILRQQTTSAFSTSQVTGNYAFGVSSILNTAQGGGKFAAVGLFNFSSGSVTGGEVDFNTNGQLDASSTNTTWPASPLTFSGGSYAISSSSGRGTLSFTLNVTGASPINTVIYVVSSTEVLVLSSDSQTNANGNAIFAGESLQQSGTPFAANPLSGSYAGYDSGLGSTSTGRSEIALVGPLASGNNALSATLLRNDGGTFASLAIKGTYSVSSTGRMINTAGGFPSVLYLVSGSQAFFLRSNASVDSGFFESQSGGLFSNSSASGTYAFGAIDPENLNGADTSGVATFTPATTSTSITYDGNQSGGTPGLDLMQSLTYSVDSTGLGMFPSGCSISVTPPTCQMLFYIISPTKAVLMNTQSSNPKLYPLDR